MMIILSNTQNEYNIQIKRSFGVHVFLGGTSKNQNFTCRKWHVQVRWPSITKIKEVAYNPQILQWCTFSQTLITHEALILSHTFQNFTQFNGLGSNAVPMQYCTGCNTPYHVLQKKYIYIFYIFKFYFLLYFNLKKKKKI